MSIEAMKQINWEPIQEFWRNNSSLSWDELELAIKAAIEQAEEQRPHYTWQYAKDYIASRQAEKQEPVVWRKKWAHKNGDEWEYSWFKRYHDAEPLYTAPPHFIDPAKVARLLDEAKERGKKEAVSEQAEKQEPVAWADKYDIEREGHDFYVNRQQPAKDGEPLYTAPPQRKEWVGLTDEEIKAAWSQLWYDLGNGKFAASDDPSRHTTVMFARAIEQAIKEKNT